MNAETYTPWDSAELLADDEMIIEYLKAALEENDPSFFTKAVGNVARAKGHDLHRPENPNWAVQACTRRCPVSETHE